MKKELLEQLKDKLEKEKEKLRTELEAFAKEDTRPKGDWDTRYPNFDGGNLEEEANEVEEYEKLLSVEYSLELRLKDINFALEKIKKGTYGICEKCEKEISPERLNACPEARICTNCKK